jgi:hypothetical protein
MTPATTRTQVPVRVRADIFPAVLVVAPATSSHPATILSYPQPDDPDGRRLLDKVRVLVTDTHVYVFQDSSQGPQVIFSEPLDTYTPATPLHQRRTRDASKPSEALATTQSGKSLAFARQGGCGCGSRLKTFDPFKVILAQARESERESDDTS